MFGSSQGLSFGSGGYAPSASQDVSTTPEKKVRQEDKQTCIPLTVRMLSDAAASRADDGAEVRIHGVELANFVLVGVVENLVEQATGLDFVLNDATGRIKVRHYQNGESKPSITAGNYAIVVGSLRTTPMMYVSALSTRLTTSADEVSYHMIEVAYAALKLQKGGSKAPAALSTPAKQLTASATPGDSLSPPKAVQASPEAMEIEKPVPAATSQPLKGAALKDALIEFVRKEGEGKDEGLAVGSIVDHFKVTPAEDIRGVVQKLVDEGEAFFTIDDAHISLL